MPQIDVFTSSSARDADGNALTKAIVTDIQDGELAEGDLERLDEWLSSTDTHVLVLAVPAEVRVHS